MERTHCAEAISPLDIPCGVGNDLKYILPVSKKVVYIDIALRAIKELKATYRQKNGFCHVRMEAASYVHNRSYMPLWKRYTNMKIE